MLKNISRGLRFNPTKTRCITFGNLSSAVGGGIWLVLPQRKYIGSYTLVLHYQMIMVIILTIISSPHGAISISLQLAGICINRTITETLTHLLYQAVIRTVLTFGLVLVHQSEKPSKDVREV